MKANEIEDALLKAIDLQIKKRLKDLSFNYYIEGKIKSVNSDGSYTINTNGSDETLFARSGLTLKVNDVVLICVPNGNQSFKFIDLKRPY